MRTRAARTASDWRRCFPGERREHLLARSLERVHAQVEGCGLLQGAAERHDFLGGPLAHDR